MTDLTTADIDADVRRIRTRLTGLQWATLAPLVTELAAQARRLATIREETLEEAKVAILALIVPGPPWPGMTHIQIGSALAARFSYQKAAEVLEALKAKP